MTAKCTRCTGAFLRCILKVEMQDNYLQYEDFQRGNVLSYVCELCRWRVLIDAWLWVPSFVFPHLNIITAACISLYFPTPSSLFLILFLKNPLCSATLTCFAPLLSSFLPLVNFVLLVSPFLYFYFSPFSSIELHASIYPSLHIISPSPLLVWLAAVVFKQSDRPLWPMILSGPDSLLSPWWGMAEALLCLALNYYWG